MLFRAVERAWEALDKTTLRVRDITQVFDAALPDFKMANVFLLGRDLRSMATNEEAKYVEKFLERVIESEESLDAEDFGRRIFQGQIRALRMGFKGQRHGLQNASA